MKRISLLVTALAAVFFFHSQTAPAATVTAVLCSGAEFPCNNVDVLDSGFRANGAAVLLGNRYTLLPFVFDDPFANFTGTMLAVDSQNKFIYIWGGGVGTDKTGAKVYLDVQLSQSYQTQPGNWSFSEFNSGGCNPAAVAAGDAIPATLAINGATPLPVMNANCAGGGGNFSLSGGPAGVLIGNTTNMTALAQFVFNVGAANQAISLPWGQDFPDPAILTFPDPNNLPAGFTEQAPEPATLLLIGTGLLALGIGVRSRRKSGRS